MPPENGRPGGLGMPLGCVAGLVELWGGAASDKGRPVGPISFMCALGNCGTGPVIPFWREVCIGAWEKLGGGP
jgi:hypothetical protein